MRGGGEIGVEYFFRKKLLQHPIKATKKCLHIIHAPLFTGKNNFLVLILFGEKYLQALPKSCTPPSPHKSND